MGKSKSAGGMRPTHYSQFPVVALVEARDHRFHSSADRPSDTAGVVVVSQLAWIKKKSRSMLIAPSVTTLEGAPCTRLLDFRKATATPRGIAWGTPIRRSGLQFYACTVISTQQSKICDWPPAERCRFSVDCFADQAQDTRPCYNQNTMGITKMG